MTAAKGWRRARKREFARRRARRPPPAQTAWWERRESPRPPRRARKPQSRGRPTPCESGVRERTARKPQRILQDSAQQRVQRRRSWSDPFLLRCIVRCPPHHAAGQRAHRLPKTPRRQARQRPRPPQRTLRFPEGLRRHSGRFDFPRAFAAIGTRELRGKRRRLRAEYIGLPKSTATGRRTSGASPVISSALATMRSPLAFNAIIAFAIISIASSAKRISPRMRRSSKHARATHALPL